MKKVTAVLVLCVGISVLVVAGCKQSLVQNKPRRITGADVYRFKSRFKSKHVYRDGEQSRVGNTFTGSLTVLPSSNHLREVTLDLKATKGWQPSLRSRLENGAKGIPPAEGHVHGRIDSSGHLKWEEGGEVGFQRDLQVLLGMTGRLTNSLARTITMPISDFWDPRFTGTLVMTRSKAKRLLSYEIRLVAADPSTSQTIEANGTAEIDPNGTTMLNATLDIREQLESKITIDKQTVSFDVTTQRTTSLARGRARSDREKRE